MILGYSVSVSNPTALFFFFLNDNLVQGHINSSNLVPLQIMNQLFLT
jgi:hypothetical protein